MKSVKPTWVVFDAGGVLFDFEKALTLSAEYLGINRNKILSAILAKSKDAEINKKYYKDIWKEILLSLKIDDKIEETFSILFSPERYVLNTLLLVEELSNAGYRIAILTNTWSRVTREIMAKIKVFQCFEYIFDSSELGLRKPDSEIFFYVEKTLHSDGNSIFFIDDNMSNVKAVKKLNWQTFHYSIGNDEGLASNDQIRKILLD